MKLRGPAIEDMFALVDDEHTELRLLLHALQRIERITMATQQEVEELVTDVATIQTDLENAKTNIETEFAELEQKLAEGQTPSPVDLAPLKSAIEGLTPQAEALENLKSNPPAATPASAAAPALTPAEIDAAAAQQAGS